MSEPLEMLLAGQEYWRDIGNDALIAGLIAEAAIIVFMSEDTRRKTLKRTLEFLAALVVLGGVWLETDHGHRVDELNRQIRQGSAEKIAVLDHQTEVLKAENLRLEYIVQPRRLSDSQKGALKISLQALGKHAALIRIPFGDGECAALAVQIGDAVEGAKWDVETVPVVATEIVHFGVAIGSTDDAESRELADTVTSLLWNLSDLRPATVSGDPEGSLPIQIRPPRLVAGEPHIVFMIGHKPLPQ